MWMLAEAYGESYPTTEEVFEALASHSRPSVLLISLLSVRHAGF